MSRRLWIGLGILAAAIAAAFALRPGANAPVHEPRAPVVLVFAEKDVVHVRWIPEARAGVAGTVVERRAQGGEWAKLAELKPDWDVAKIRKILGRQSEALLQFLFDKPYPESGAIPEEKLRAFEKQGGGALLTALSGLRPELARLWAELHDDRDIQAGTTFEYRVSGVGTSRAVKHGEAEAVPRPEKVAAEAGDGVVRLAWAHDPARSKSGEVIAYDVYRSEKPGGPFEKANPSPVIPVRVGDAAARYFFADRLVKNGVEYHYHVRSLNLVGMASEPSETVRVTPRAGAGVPSEFSWKPVGNRPVFSWKADAPCEILRGPTPEGPWEVAVKAGSTDTAYRPGTRVWYVVRIAGAADFAGPVEVFLPDREAPPRPTGLEAKAEKGRIVLRWKAVEADDLQGYVVERATSPDGPFATSFAGPVTKPEAEEPIGTEITFYYRVVAVDQAGNRSAPSELAKIRSFDTTAPNPVRIQDARAVGDEIVIRWGRPLAEDLAGFHVYRSSGGEFARLTEKPLTATEYRDRPEGGEWYSYAVTAVDQSGNESPKGEPVPVRWTDLAAPPAPTGLKASFADGRVALAWDASPAKDLRHYLVLRRSPGKKDFLEYAEPKKNSHSDARVVPGKYAYRVVAVDRAGNRSEPATVEIEVPK
jgi:fibronectin type 3 domain-containing protein